MVAGESLGRSLTSSHLKKSLGEGVREGVPGTRCFGAGGTANVGVSGCFQTITSSSSAKGNESSDPSMSCARPIGGNKGAGTASSTADEGNCTTIAQ